MKGSILLFGFLILALSGLSQVQSTQDSLIIESQDTVLLKSYATRYNPRRALLLAAVVPGLGQIYNKKYWKLPLVYGGMFATGYAMDYYNDLYREYKFVLYSALEQGLDENEIDSDPVSQGGLGMRTTVRGYRNAVDKAQRERDFMIIIMGLVYVLQIVDAHVDAHLKEFDLNPRLQVRLEPLIEQNYLTGRQTGLSLVLKL
jgi:hypothetical protein